MSVKDGATGTIGQTREKAVKKQADRAALAKGKNASKADQKAMMQQAQKNRMREEMAREGEFVHKGDVNSNLPFIWNCGRIGKWGIVERGDTTFSKIAQKIYKDAGMWKFIADANGYSDNKVKKGTCLYVPDISVMNYKIDDGTNYVQYAYANVQLIKEKGTKTSGDIKILSYSNVIYVEYLFKGLKYTAPFLEKQELSWEAYHKDHKKADKLPQPTPSPRPQTQATHMPQPTPGPAPKATVRQAPQATPMVDKGSVCPEDKLINGMLYRSNEVSATLDSIGAHNANKNINIKFDSKKVPLFKAKGADRFATPRLKGQAFGKRLIRSGLKGNIVMTLLWAGAKAVDDYENNKDIGHASLKFGVESVKGAASASAGIMATSAAFACVPGVGWAFLAAVGAGIVVNWGVAVLLDIGEKKLAGDW